MELILGHAFTEFEQAEPGGPLTLHFQDQVPRRSLVLVGADGYRSVVRAQTVGDGEPLDTGTMTWRGRVSTEALAPLKEPFDSGAGFQLVVGEGKNFWIMQAGPHHIAWGGTARNPSLSPGVGALVHALETFANWPAICQCCIHDTAQEAIVESGVFDRLPVPSWGDGKRVSLLGDAAHPIRPSLGMGTTLAFEDAVALAASLEGIHLEDSAAVALALLRYENERIAITAPLQEQARREGDASHAEDQADRMADGFRRMLAAKGG